MPDAEKQVVCVCPETGYSWLQSKPGKLYPPKTYWWRIKSLVKDEVCSQERIDKYLKDNPLKEEKPEPPKAPEAPKPVPKPAEAPKPAPKPAEAPKEGEKSE